MMRRDSGVAPVSMVLGGARREIEGVIAAFCRADRRFPSCLRAAVASSLRLLGLCPRCVPLSPVLRARRDAFSAHRRRRTPATPRRSRIFS